MISTSWLAGAPVGGQRVWSLHPRPLRDGAPILNRGREMDLSASKVASNSAEVIARRLFRFAVAVVVLELSPPVNASQPVFTPYGTTSGGQTFTGVFAAPNYSETANAGTAVACGNLGSS